VSLCLFTVPAAGGFPLTWLRSGSMSDCKFNQITRKGLWEGKSTSTHRKQVTKFHTELLPCSVSDQWMNQKWLVNRNQAFRLFSFLSSLLFLCTIANVLGYVTPNGLFCETHNTPNWNTHCVGLLSGPLCLTHFTWVERVLVMNGSLSTFHVINLSIDRYAGRNPSVPGNRFVLGKRTAEWKKKNFSFASKKHINCASLFHSLLSLFLLPKQPAYCKKVANIHKSQVSYGK
jgi:hypothetical protein